jgi:hypothetical protein
MPPGAASIVASSHGPPGILASSADSTSGSIKLGVPPPKYMVSGVHGHSVFRSSVRTASIYPGSSAAGKTPDAKLQYVHFCAQNG